MSVINPWELLLPRLREQVTNGVLSVDLVADFCHVEPLTVFGWLDEKRPATGERLIRLWWLLEVSGSPSPEIKKMPLFNQILSALFAFDVMSREDVFLYSGIKPSPGGGIYQTLRGMPVMHPQVGIEELRAEYGERLEGAREDVRQRMGRTPESSQQDPSSTPAPASESDSGLPSEAVSVALDEVSKASSLTVGADVKLLLSSLLGAAAPLAKQLNSNAVSAEERSAFRDLITPEVLFELSNTLNALCSERARGMAR